MQKTRVCFSLVLYKHTIESIEALLASIGSLAGSSQEFRFLLCVYDGSPLNCPSASESQIQTRLSSVDIFFERGANVGFGRANNINFNRASLSESDIFVTVNPDILFKADDLIPIFGWVLENPDCTCVAPLVLLYDGKTQYSAKHDPTILSLLIGLFSFLRRINVFHRYEAWHKNLRKDYKTEIIQSSYLSGCFLVIPSWAFDSVGGFCDKYFLHVEDADIVRRLSEIGATFHNPIGVVFHGWSRGSHSSIPQIISLIKSYMIYSFIWGWKVF